MNKMSFKEKVDLATDFIISCWDENNENDGKTFDERIQDRIDSLDEEIAEIVRIYIEW